MSLFPPAFRKGRGRRCAGKSQLQAASLEPKVIRGVYEFLGHVPIVSAAAHAVAGYKYVYVLSKEKGVWTMIG